MVGQRATTTTTTNEQAGKWPCLYHNYLCTRCNYSYGHCLLLPLLLLHTLHNVYCASIYYWHIVSWTTAVCKRCFTMDKNNNNLDTWMMTNATAHWHCYCTIVLMRLVLGRREKNETNENNRLSTTQWAPFLLLQLLPDQHHPNN